jgi:hypothetical protein
VFQTTAGRSFGIGLSHRDVHEKALKKLGSSFKAAIRDSKRGDDKHNPGSSMNGAAYGKAEQHNREIHENDVWHHLEHPANALAEFRRVLVPRGRVIILEPAMSVVGRLVYGNCHHEPWASTRLCLISWPISAAPVAHVICSAVIVSPCFRAARASGIA